MIQNKLNKQELSKNILEISKKRPYKVLLRHESLTFKKIDTARRLAKPCTIIKKIKNRIAKIAFKDSHEDFLKALKQQNILIISDDLFDAFQVATNLTKDNDSVKIIAATSKTDLIKSTLTDNIVKFKSYKGLQSALLNVISEVYKKPLRLILSKSEKQGVNNAN